MLDWLALHLVLQATMTLGLTPFVMTATKLAWAARDILWNVTGDWCKHIYPGIANLCTGLLSLPAQEQDAHLYAASWTGNQEDAVDAPDITPGSLTEWCWHKGGGRGHQNRPPDKQYPGGCLSCTKAH